MTKKEFIERYGEDAYKKQLEINRKWREEHKEYKKEYLKAYRESNKEKISAYRSEHKKEIEEQRKRYRTENKEKIAARRHESYIKNIEKIRAYKEQHKEEISAYNASRRNIHREYMAVRRSTQHGRAESLVGSYNLRDKKRGFDISQNIDAEWMVDNIFNSSCIYCGESDWTKLGADRIDNTNGHTPDNCVCACRKCNENRSSNYSVEEFVEKMKKEKGGA